MQVRARMWRGPEGGWEARAELAQPVLATAPTSESCLEALGRAVEAAVASSPVRDPEGAGGLMLIVEMVPVLAGVAEASEVMGWDKRRVVTYLDRGSFPPPVQTLRSGRVWLRADLERFAEHWRARQEARRARKRSRRDP